MPKPDFFIVGAPKCGTTALCKYLDQHPSIFIPPIKELYYFCPDIMAKLNKAPRAKTLEEYLSFFADGEGKVCGEGSVFYLASEVAAQRIKKFNPNAKIIIMLREPVSLMYSFHSMNVANGEMVIKDFKLALNNKIWGLIYRELVQFTEQIQRYLNCFEREQIHIIVFDEFKNDTAKIYQETLEFLGVDPIFKTEFSPRNPNRKVQSARLQNIIVHPPAKVLEMGKFLLPFPRPIRRQLLENIKKLLKRFNTQTAPRPSLDLEFQRSLQEELAPEVEKLRVLLGRDLTSWS